MIVTIVGTAPMTGSSEAFAINDRGVVVKQEDLFFPFVWRPNVPNDTSGVSTRLPLLPHPIQPEGAAMAINGRGMLSVIAQRQTPSARRLIELCCGEAEQAAPFQLGTLLPNITPNTFLGESRARAINDQGQIVGDSTSITGSIHAFLS